MFLYELSKSRDKTGGQLRREIITLMPYRGFRAQRFYLNLLPVLGFLHHSTDLDEPDKPVTPVFLISQHMKVTGLLKMELSPPGPIFCVHKGSIVQRFSIEPLCRR